MEAQNTPDLSEPLFELLRTLRKRARTIRIFAMVTAGIVVAGAWLQTPIYRATASVLIDMETPTVIGVSQIRDESTLSQMNYFAYADYYRTQLEVLTSRAIAEEVFRNLKLDAKDPYRNKKDPVGALMAQIEIEPVKQTRLANIRVEDPNPQRAARIANELALVFAVENLRKTSAAEAVTLAKTEYLKLQLREAELSKRYKARHPSIVRVRKEMEELAQTIEQETKRKLGEPEPDLMEEGSESSWSARLRESTVSDSLRRNNIRVQDLAQVPLKPVRPKRFLSLLLGLLMGLLGGVALAVVQELLDTTLKSPQDIEQDGRLVLLGHVPRMSQQDGMRDPFSPASEAYRFIRTSLTYADPTENARIIAFTSPGPEEGKTTTVSNLGMAMAQNGSRVLLVDADMRRGRLHQVFNVRKSPGLSDFLMGKASFEEVVQKTETPGLFVVACGVFAPSPAERIGSAPMRSFLERASQAYERVLVDTPPIMAVTDAAIVASMTKSMIAVVQSGKTPRQALHRLSRTCNDVQAKLLGVVLNNVPEWSTPYYYRYSYSSYTFPQQKERRFYNSSPS